MTKRGENIYKRIIKIWDNLVSINIVNPLKTWIKARKYFKRPLISIHFFTNIYRNCPYYSIRNVPKLLCIDCQDVGYKWKYESISHEHNPYIWVCFFRTFGFSINFRVFYIDEFGEKQNGDTYYWEYLLDYLYRTKTLQLDSWWQGTSKVFKDIKYGNTESEDVQIPLKIPIFVQLFSLNKQGLKQFKKLYGKPM